MKKPEGVSALVLCALGWSLGGIFLKYVSVNSFAAAGIRSLFSFIVMAVLSRQLPHFFVKNEATGKVDSAQTVYMWISALCYAATMILYCVSNKLTYAANVIFLEYTSPVWVILFSSIILGEKNTKIDYITFTGIAAGMLLFFADDLLAKKNGSVSETMFLGNVLAAFSGITWAGTTLFQRKQQILIAQRIREFGTDAVSKHNTSRDAFMLAQILTALFGLPFIFLMKGGIPNMQSIIFLFLMGLFQMGLPNILYSVGIKNVTALSASLITMIEPLMNPVWVFIFVHEKPTVKCLMGGVIILGFILLREFVSKKRVPR